LCWGRFIDWQHCGRVQRNNVLHPPHFVASQQLCNETATKKAWQIGIHLPTHHNNLPLCHAIWWKRKDLDKEFIIELKVGVLRPIEQIYEWVY